MPSEPGGSGGSRPRSSSTRQGAIRYWYLGELDWAQPKILRTVESLLPDAH